MLRKLARGLNDLIVAYTLLFAAVGLYQLFKDLVDSFRNRFKKNRNN